MNLAEYEQIKDQISSARSLSFTDSFALAKRCGQLLGQEETEHYGRDLAIRILEHFNKVDPKTKEIWNDLVEASGLHPYVSKGSLSSGAAVRHEFHRSRSLNEVYLHSEQLNLSALLEQGKSVVVSAPTSFGKSLLIEEVVASNQYRNLVIIQPTLALLDETRKKLGKYRTSYQLVMSTHQKPSLNRNIFLFTGERVVEYKEFPPIEFFVIDEFYKLSLERDDDRAIALNQALYRLLKMTNKFYLLGPNIRSISPEFLTRQGAQWHYSHYATVSVDIDKRYEGKNWKGRGTKANQEREKELFSLLRTLEEPTIIYCASPDKATGLADRFAAHMSDGRLTPSQRKTYSINGDMVEWIGSNIHDRWSLARTLKSGVAFHHGQVPLHLGSSIVDSFNHGHIRFLFCTATLIEGVNTTARHVVLFDQKKGLQPIDFFDYKNIVGRSGRMKVHYVGKVYEFHKEPAQLELDVELLLMAQATAPLELLVQLNEQDIEQPAKNRLIGFKSLDDELKAIIKKNSGLSVEGQMSLLKEIEEAQQQFYPLLAWKAVPSYQQLSATLELCWRHFLKPKESRHGVRTSKQLAVMALQYHEGRSVKSLIARNIEYWKRQETEEDEAIQKAVQLSLSVARNWFEYKLPKWLIGISELQTYIYKKKNQMPGNYAYFCGLLENSFLKGSLSILMDYDVPISAIRKLENLFREQDDWPTVEDRLRSIDLDSLGLLPYELKKLRAAIREPEVSRHS